MGSLTLHGSAVSCLGRGVLILGPSGTGKSSLALRLMAYGAKLIADDQVALTREGGRLLASAPAGLPAMIEARGIGLLHADLVAKVPLCLAVSLGADVPSPRLPPIGHISLIDIRLELVSSVISDHLASAIWHYANAGRAV